MFVALYIVSVCVCSIKYSENVFVALHIQHETRTRHIAICGVPFSTIFPHYLIEGAIFEKQIRNTKCAFGFSLHFCLSYSFYEKLS